MRRRLAAVVLAVIALGGCATASRAPSAGEPPSVTEFPPEARVGEARQACHQSAASAAGSSVLAAALQSAGLASAYLILRGAADGALWGFIAGGGGGAKDGAWIGAAVGGGVGILIGTGVGVKEGIDAYGRYRSAFDTCVAWRLAPPSDQPAASPDEHLAVLLPIDADW